jgi:hypothetical protein
VPGRVCGEEAERAAITQQQEDENCMAAANGCREGRRPFAESRDSVSGRVWGSAPRSPLHHRIQCHQRHSIGMESVMKTKYEQVKSMPSQCKQVKDKR